MNFTRNPDCTETKVDGRAAHNRRNKDAQSLYMWNSLHGVWQHRRKRIIDLIHDAKHHDFVRQDVSRKRADSYIIVRSSFNRGIRWL